VPFCVSTLLAWVDGVGRCGLPSGSLRRAERSRKRILECCDAATPGRLAEVARRGRLGPSPDGFPGRTTGDGPRAVALLTSVESAAERLVFAGSEGTPLVVPDPVGRLVAECFGAYWAMGASAAAALDVLGFPGGLPLPDVRREPVAAARAAVGLARRLCAQPSGEPSWLRDVERYAVRADRRLVSLTARPSLRVPSVSGPCGCCEREVSGSPADRMRSGYCTACWWAWRREGRPERFGFEVRRRSWLAEQGRREGEG